MSHAILALGGNVGDVESTFRQALLALGDSGVKVLNFRSFTLLCARNGIWLQMILLRPLMCAPVGLKDFESVQQPSNARDRPAYVLERRNLGKNIFRC
jgi:hypothetical protein